MILSTDTTPITPPEALPTSGIMTWEYGSARSKVGTWRIEGSNLIGDFYQLYDIFEEEIKKNVRSRRYRNYREIIQNPERYKKLPKRITHERFYHLVDNHLLSTVFKDTQSRVTKINFISPGTAQKEAKKIGSTWCLAVGDYDVCPIEIGDE